MLILSLNIPRSDREITNLLIYVNLHRQLKRHAVVSKGNTESPTDKGQLYEFYNQLFQKEKEQDRKVRYPDDYQHAGGSADGVRGNELYVRCMMEDV